MIKNENVCSDAMNDQDTISKNQDIDFHLLAKL